MYRVKMKDGTILQSLLIDEPKARKEILEKLMAWITKNQPEWLRLQVKNVMGLGDALLFAVATRFFVNVEEGVEMGTNEAMLELMDTNEDEVIQAVGGFLGIELGEVIEDEDEGVEGVEVEGVKETQD